MNNNVYEGDKSVVHIGFNNDATYKENETKIKESEKRKEYLSWEEYFIELAKVAAKRSKDPSTQVGCCIVDKDHNILSLGYNGFPKGCSDDNFPWGKTSEDWLENKYAYVVHAELNAILNYKRSLEGAILYVTLYPCNECAKAIIQSGIKEVVYLDDPNNPGKKEIASGMMFKAAGVEVRKMK